MLTFAQVVVIPDVLGITIFTLKANVSIYTNTFVVLAFYCTYWITTST